MSTITAAGKRKEVNVPAKYSRQFSNDISLLTAVRKGLKPEAVFEFMSLSGLPVTKIEQILGKTVKTFQSYRQHHTLLDPTISEKLLKLFQLYDKGRVIFASAESFNRWMSMSAFGLGGQIPENMLDTITGIQLILEELIRIEYGALA